MVKWMLPLLLNLPLAGIAHAGEPVLASRLDYTLNVSRERPVVCKPGDIEHFPGQTLAQVFGDRWPVQPDPEPGSERVHAQMVESVRHRGALKGMPAQPGLVVFAVLVDASGAPLQTEVLCSSTEGYDRSARRIAQQSKYKPAVINGNAVTSVVVHVQKFGGGGT